MKKRSSLSAEDRTASFLSDLIMEGQEALDFVDGMTFPDFVKRSLERHAVMKALENVAEATKHLPASLKKRHPIVDWRGIAGFRTKTAHHYWEIDWSLVWSVLKEHLPSLLDVARSELERIEL